MDQIVDTNEHQPANLKSILSSINNIRKADENATDREHHSRLSASDNGSAPFSIPASDQPAVIAELRKYADDQSNTAVAQAPEFYLSACLHARKGDISRSFALADNFMKFRQKFSYDLSVAQSPIVHDILASGVLVFPGNVSRDGRPILTIRYRFFDPRKFPSADVVRTLALMFDWILRTNPTAMTHGLVAMEDVAGFSLRNMDLRLMTFFEKALSSVLPLRVAALHVVNPGIIIRTLFALFSAFFSDKIKARIRLFGKGEEEKLAEFIAPEQNPAFLGLGGTLDWTEQNQIQMADRIVKDAKEWELSDALNCKSQ